MSQGGTPADGRGPRVARTVLRSARREVVIGDDRPFCIIGERINPTGRSAFQAQLRAGDLSQLAVDVAQQVAGGAMVLDVNLGAPLVDEVGLMSRAVRRVQSLTDLPLCIDASAVATLEAGLAAYEGKALVNSVTAEDDRLGAILPLVRRHGAAVVCLPIDDTAIPVDPARRLELARKIADVAVDRYGIPLEDLVFDPLATPIATDPGAVVRVLDTIRLLGDELGVTTTVGASNVSFGLAERVGIGAAFLAMAAGAGLPSALMDARSPDLVRAVRATDLLRGRSGGPAEGVQ